MTVDPTFTPRFEISDLEKWAAKYNYAREEKDAEAAADAAIKRGYMTKAEFLSVVHWKSPRREKLAGENSEDDIRDATGSAFSTSNARVRVGALVTLRGVGYPMASAILHLACKDVPLLDVNALAALGVKQPSIYNFSFWRSYCAAVHEIQERTRLPLRTIDKALWSFGKKHKIP